MPNIIPLNIHTADPQTAKTLNAVKVKIGMIPNLFSTFALSPVVLDAYLHFSGKLEAGRLTARQREIVALTVAQINNCGYCLSAHTMIGKGAGLSDDDILLARNSKAANSTDQAISTLAQNIVQTKGKLTANDLQLARNAGLDDGLIVEVIANVTLNILTNYTNNVADTDVDFPKVSVSL